MTAVQEPAFIGIDAVIEIHRRLIDRHGGTHGIREEGLLMSALAQPEQAFGGQFLHEFPFQMAAAYLYHLCQNHPFHDGNKRIALTISATFLGLNGYWLDTENDAARDLVLQVASSQLDKDSITAFLKDRSVPL